MIRLVRAELHLMEAALAGDDALAGALGHDVVAGWATFTEALQPIRDALAANPAGSAWGARFFVARDPPELVGWGGFKGPPQDGVAEVGYAIAEARRGRGLATAATRAMLAEAFADEQVTAVIAHTLPERNASNRVLEKAGFRFEGEAEEHDEIVWRFSLARPARVREGLGGGRVPDSVRYDSGMAGHRIYKLSVASVYPHYVAKAEKKGRTKEELDHILCWLTGYGPSELSAQLEQGTDFETFFAEAPALNPSRKLITGVICGVRVEEIEDPLMREIRYVDKLVDELARGKAMEKILRTP